MTEKGIAFEKLLSIMDELREKCPWDRKQTLESLRHLTIEETYELADSILDQNMVEIKRNKNSLMDALPTYADRIKTIIEAKKLRLKSDADWRITLTGPKP